MGFFDELGLKFKIERGNRVFPESDHSSDVIGALSRQMKKLGVNVLLNTQVVAVNEENGEFAGVVVKDASGQKVMRALLQQAVIHIHPQALQGMVTDLLKVWDTALHQYFRHLYLLM